MELKLEEDFDDNETKAHVLTQVVAYLGQLFYLLQQGTESQYRKAIDTFKGAKELNGKLDRMPSTVLVGSKYNCFAIATSELKHHYANLDIMAIKKASDFYTTPQGNIVYQNILKDSKIAYISPVFETSDKYCMMDIAEMIYKINQNIESADDLSPKNLYRAFTRFTTRVLTEESVDKLTNREQAALFARFIVNRNSIGKITDLDNNLVALDIDGLKITVNNLEWNVFSWIYNLKQYSEAEQKKITAITDILLAEDDRRRKGDYYTPAIWVNEAHKLLDRNLEPDWRKTYMVWDCAWGTGNLTRDCTKVNGTYIDDLYCSTLEQTGLDIGERYNRKACKFQYDFLNDDVDAFNAYKFKIDQANQLAATNIDLARMLLRQANETLYKTKLYGCAPKLINGLLGCDLEQYVTTGKIVEYTKKKLLFLINPPYGTSKNGGTDRVSKAGTADTLTNEDMKDDKIGACSQQLYAQFLYRINKIKELFNSDVKIGIFAPPAYMTGPTYKNFRSTIGKNFAPKEVFIIQGNQFADVKGSWGISFALLTNNGKYNIEASILNKVNENKVECLGKKTLYNLDDKESLSNWIKPKGKGIDAPQMSNAINWKQEGRGKLIPGALGYMMFNANNVEQSIQFVTYTSSCMAGANGVSIMPETFERCISGFCARSLMASQSNWVIGHDEFMVPDINNEKYNQWVSDCIVLSMFHSKSNPSSLRNVDYKGKQWNIENQFFWMSLKNMAQLAGGYLDTKDTNDIIMDDLESFGDDRFVYKKLQEVTLSEDAQEVLDKATEIVKKSFKYRMAFSKTPEGTKYHINTWDAGWYQIKGLCKNIPEMKADMDDFNKLYKAFEDRMRPLVYELGFLYK